MTNYLDMVIFSEKIIVGPQEAQDPLLATMDHDPLYFGVHMFLDPPDPPCMARNAKMCYFEHFLGVR